MSETIEQRSTREHLGEVLHDVIGIYRRFDTLAKISVWALLTLLLLGAFAPWIVPHNPYAQDFDVFLIGPFENFSYLFGTDMFGRDVLSRLIMGARISLFVAFGSVSFAVVVGCLMGSVGAWKGGLTDDALMRLADMIFSFPSLVLALALIAVWGPSIRNLIVVIGIVYSPQYARLIRSTVLSVKEEPYVEAAISTGLDSKRVLVKHVIPNSLTPVMVQASFHLAWAILLEASLSFLGLGVQPPEASWGIMISNGRTQMPRAWWLMTFSGLMIMITVLSFNFIGDGLRSEFDPHEITGGSEDIH